MHFVGMIFLYLISRPLLSLLLLFVDMYLSAYRNRISEKNPTWEKDHSYFIPLLKEAKKKWADIPVLHNFLGISYFISFYCLIVYSFLLAATLAELKERSPRDQDGLYIVDGDHPCVKLFSVVYESIKDNWETIPLFREYIETMIR